MRSRSSGTRQTVKMKGLTGRTHAWQWWLHQGVLELLARQLERSEAKLMFLVLSWAQHHRGKTKVSIPGEHPFRRKLSKGEIITSTGELAKASGLAIKTVSKALKALGRFPWMREVRLVRGYKKQGAGALLAIRMDGLETWAARILGSGETDPQKRVG